jgi:hypothetical protein
MLKTKHFLMGNFKSMSQPEKKSFFDRFKRDNSESGVSIASENAAQSDSGDKKTTQTFLRRMRSALSRTSSGFGSLVSW